MSKRRHRKIKSDPKQRAKDYEKMKAAPAELYFDIAVAIIKNALDDYANCLDAIYKDPKDAMSRSEKIALEHWIRGNDFAALSLDCIDPEAVIKRYKQACKQKHYQERILQAAERRDDEIREDHQDT